MKKLSVNNMLNNNGMNGHRQAGLNEHRRHSPIPAQDGNFTNNYSSNNSGNNNDLNPARNQPQTMQKKNSYHPVIKPYQQKRSPNRYEHQQSNQFLIQQA